MRFQEVIKPSIRSPTLKSRVRNSSSVWTRRELNSDKLRPRIGTAISNFLSRQGEEETRDE